MAWGLAEFDAEQRGKKAGYCEGLSDGISQGISQGITQGEHKAKIETAKNLVAKKISIDIIAECTGLPVETIENLM